MDCVLTYLLGQLARLLWRVEDLVVEDGEVERQSQADGVRGLHLRLGDLKGLLVRLLGVLQHAVAVVAGGNLGQVSVANVTGEEDFELNFKRLYFCGNFARYAGVALSLSLTCSNLPSS